MVLKNTRVWFLSPTVQMRQKPLVNWSFEYVFLTSLFIGHNFMLVIVWMIVVQKGYFDPRKTENWGLRIEDCEGWYNTLPPPPPPPPQPSPPPPGVHKTGIRGIQDTRQIVDGKTNDIENNNKQAGAELGQAQLKLRLNFY